MSRTTVALFVLAGFAVALSGSPSQALEDQSSPLPLGTVANVQPATCPAGFFPGMTCSTAVVENCTGTVPLGFTYGVITPTNTLKGTIVLHSGGEGIAPFNQGYVAPYLSAGYQIVQVAWDLEWEFVGAGQSASLKAAACRPATFFQYVFTAIHGGLNGAGGMCAQGNSGGSAAIAYALTEYGAGSYLDKALLTSGPGFSDAKAGCIVPHAPPVTICPGGQLGCNGASWAVSPQYPLGLLSEIAEWTGDNTCNNVPPGGHTSPESNADWKEMSIVDGESDSTFTYPQTAMSAWLCSNGLNDSAPEGELYYQNFTSITQLANNGVVAYYSVNRVDQCPGAEDIWDGVVVIQGVQESGFLASTNDMLDPIVGCVKRH